MTPDDRKYTQTHEWVKVDGDVAVVGISDHAQNALGDVTFVELPGVGDRVTAGAEFGVIESVKAASDLLAPVSGEVAEINSGLDDMPEKLNESPYEEGWIIKIKDFDAAEMDGLMSADVYEAALD